MNRHRLFDKWLSGSTCRHGNERHCILLENDDYIVFKHAGHSEYINRMTGTKYCETYVALFRKDIDEYDLRYGYNAVRKWITPKHRRVNVDQIKQACLEDYGIRFDDDYVSDQWYEPEPPTETELTRQAKALTSVDDIKI